ncbi:The BTB (BR-C, ttk and bab)/POZ (Pox virus and Zinc finger) domain [Ceratobasidium sp. AG-Ba]|nr:The BTB (BR-C, ttk and bab)/POZ (Pox virus and Zinc finger) domain [Ceratobasidium sp. AG-Ba]
MASHTTNHHAKYYFEDGSVVFLTSNKTLFRLHKSVLRLHSTFFDDLFQLEQPNTLDEEGNTLPPEGSSDNNPIVTDVRDTEFESMCDALYEMPLMSPSELPVDQAIPLLRASTKFQLESIHDKAIRTLESAPLPPWTRYALAADCLVDSWAVRSYLGICSSVDYYPAEIVAEFTQRGEDMKLSRLFKLREDYRTKLLIYAHGTERFPYPKLSPPTTSICPNCLIYSKQVLVQVLSGNSAVYLEEKVINSTPLLEDRIVQVIKAPNSPGVSICATCRAKEKNIIDQILGMEDLEVELKKVMHLAP